MCQCKAGTFSGFDIEKQRKGGEQRLALWKEIFTKEILTQNVPKRTMMNYGAQPKFIVMEVIFLKNGVTADAQVNEYSLFHFPSGIQEFFL